MKIIIIQPRISYYVGGGEKIPLKHAEYLAPLGNEILILTTAIPKNQQSFLYQDFKKNKHPNIHIKEFKIPKKFEYLYKIQPGTDRARWDTESVMFGDLIQNDLVNFKPDIVLSYYVLDGIYNNFKAKNILYLLGYPTENIEARKPFLRFYDCIFCVSSTVREKWHNQFLKKQKVFTLNSGVDLVETVKLIKFNFKRNIVFAGRLIERKGVMTLLMAFSKIVTKIPGVHLWIAGDGPQKKEIVSQIKKMNLDKQITLVGLIKNVSGFLAAADLAVFPSYEKEGLMGVVLEAMAVGLAVITTFGNGNEDVIKNGQSGILVKPRQPKELSLAILKLLKNDKLRKQIGINAKKTIKNKNTWKQKTSEFNDLLIKLKNYKK
ncbi:MAG: glycosyltransferase family 4 protein [Patescibacteria group bacterium]|nr:glycosyltransferase family 4 protein [Patescibacteria group bacterium]